MYTPQTLRPEDIKTVLSDFPGQGAQLTALVEYLSEHPLISTEEIQHALGIRHKNISVLAQRANKHLEKHGLYIACRVDPVPRAKHVACVWAVYKLNPNACV